MSHSPGYSGSMARTFTTHLRESWRCVKCSASPQLVFCLLQVSLSALSVVSVHSHSNQNEDEAHLSGRPLAKRLAAKLTALPPADLQGKVQSPSVYTDFYSLGVNL